MNRYDFFIDPNRCIGCQACVRRVPSATPTAASR